jgi:hypothetical protein
MQFTSAEIVCVGDGIIMGVAVTTTWINGVEVNDVVVNDMVVNVCDKAVELGVRVGDWELLLPSASANDKPPTTSTMEIRAYKRPFPTWRATCII